MIGSNRPIVCVYRAFVRKVLDEIGAYEFIVENFVEEGSISLKNFPSIFRGSFRLHHVRSY